METYKPPSIEDEAIRGRECRAVLENRYVKEALDAIEEAMIEGLVTCPVKDLALQNELVNILRAKRKFVEHLKTHIETGQLAEHQRDAEEAKKAPGLLRKLFA